MGRMGRSECPLYADGEHCFTPGVLRTVCPGDEPIFTFKAAALADDERVECAKRCECGEVVKAVK